MQELSIQAGMNAARGTGMATDLFGQAGVFQHLSNTLLFLVGAISVIMLIIGGLRYVVSGGNHESVTAAKNTILYAIIGVIVCILAYSVVNFVITTFAADTGAL